ncbi:hypothetical protein HDU76_005323 [Blyttiomyces sp. JEL0837]|nr:hypothetical protein HDU76_005323 [Blyttiomyces sp. JEL0837]
MASQQPESERLLRSLVAASQDDGYKVNTVRVEGIKYTKTPFVERLIQPLLKATTLHEILESSQSVSTRMHQLGIFKNVSVELDAPVGVQGDVIDVILHVEEASRIWARTGTDIGNNEGQMTAAIRVRNAMGAGESLEANVAYGVETSAPLAQNSDFSSQTASTFQVMFAKPVDANPDQTLHFTAYKSSRNHSLYSSHTEFTTGLAAKFKARTKAFGYHEIGYEAAWRQIANVPKEASWTVRQDAAHSLKSALVHTCTVEGRNDNLLPTRGYYFKSFLELAGLSGDVKHGKAELEGQFHVPLTHGFSASASLRSGLLHPLFGKQSRINDRFFVGGPLSVRGFQHSGIGPKDGNDAVGGDIHAIGGLSVFTPLPYLVNAPIKGHLFVNAASLNRLDQGKSIAENYQNLGKSFSSSWGVGLVVRFSMLRMEVNYCLPLTVTTSDLYKPGVQFGVGLNFT